MQQHSRTFVNKALILVATFSLSSNLRADDPPMPTISISGTAEIRVVPDEVVFTFSIESREKELDASVKDNDEKIKAVNQFLLNSKVEPKHIRTDMISIRPIFEQATRAGWKGQQMAPQLNASINLPDSPLESPDKLKTKIKPIGYTARRQFSVTISDLKNFELIYRGLLKQGVNDVGGIQFRTTELRKHKDAARLKAINAAREKAKALANELGATLAAVQTISESNHSPYSNFTRNSISSVESLGGGSSIAAGEMEIKATVQVVFKLGETEME